MAANTPANDPAAPVSEVLKRRQRARNMAIAGGLVLLCGLFYLITIFRLGGDVLKRAL
jgi:hypothetical protein